MSTVYVDDWGNPQMRTTVTVHEEGKSAKVTYKGDKGQSFSVMVHQKPNPIDRKR